ncbi:MAG: LysR family transcriptional regulator, low CO2-responsive transcriptional regulator [Thermoleophilaceae bacterium]|jgi:molybdate transport repressor ModE-like protein|nr:LysR family transcriptional regulator, low CO2-responsive transcriptional regulator [Thermoleophilaceae bacterium]
MTFAQLRSFATVARLGSVTASARELGVSEPAVSSAIATLRRELGDDLLVRANGGVRLTAGGARLAAAANEILGLADRARRAVGEANGEATRLPVAATSEVSEHASAPLLEAFTRRAPTVDVELQVETGQAFCDLLCDRIADVALGPRPADATRFGIESVPFLRFRLVVVAGPSHPLAGRRALAPAVLAGERWLVGPSGAGPDTDVGAFLAAHSLAPDEIRAFATHGAALHGAAAGRGVMLAVAHTVIDDLRRGTLVRLDVRGTPRDELWWCSTLAADRRPPAASWLRRFVTTPEAVQSMLVRSGGVPAERFRPPVYTTLWHG